MGQEDLHLFMVFKAFQRPERLLSLAAVLKVKLVLRCRIRKGCPPVTLQSDWAEDKDLVLPFSVAWSIIHLLGCLSLKNRSLFPTFLEAQNNFGSWAEMLSSAKRMGLWRTDARREGLFSDYIVVPVANNFLCICVQIVSNLSRWLLEA